MQAENLPLRDIHTATQPPWWPPAPGWLLVAAVVLAVAAVLCALWLRLRRRRRAVARLFDDALAQADTPAAQVAAMSELLRRAARRIDPQADRLEGEDWLRFLDAGLRQPVFAAGAGAVLRDGAFLREVSPTEVEGLREVVRARFLEWMGTKPKSARRRLGRASKVGG